MNKRKIVENCIEVNIDSAVRFAFTYMKNNQDAEDVVSESVIKALNSYNSVREVENVKAWYFKIISNTAINEIRKRQRIVPTMYIEKEEIYEDSYDILDLNDIINKLPREYTQIVLLRIFEDMKFKEIAYLLELNENTVKTKFYRALELLKVDMEEYYEY